jgi:hypothetical protein
MHVYVTEREMRRRVVRRRRLVMLAIVSGVVVLAAAAGAWVLAKGDGAPSSGPGVIAGSAATPSAVADQPGSASPTPSPSTAPAVIEVGWVGDTTPGSKYGTPPNGGRGLFESTRSLLSEPDLMIANLEGTYSTSGPSKCDGAASGACYAFQAPPSYAEALAWSGIDLVNVANNHSMDYLARGFQETQQALKQAGVAYAGLPGKVTIVKVRGVRVAVVGFSPYSWGGNLNDIPAAAKLVRRAAAEADVVIVLMHGGAEGADKIHTPTGPEYAFGELRGELRAFAHSVVNAGADLVLGSGPHVIRGVERYKDRLIAYSLGNFAGWGNFGLGGNLSLTGLLTIKIDTTGRIHGGRWLSLSLAAPGVPTVDRSNASLKLVRSLSATDFERTVRLDPKGYFKAP